MWGGAFSYSGKQLTDDAFSGGVMLIVHRCYFSFPVVVVTSAHLQPFSRGHFGIGTADLRLFNVVRWVRDIVKCRTYMVARVVSVVVLSL